MHLASKQGNKNPTITAGKTKERGQKKNRG